ncbi:MAG: hypothetical protein AAGM46_26765 [Cyanobacteria bacterium J06582_2]
MPESSAALAVDHNEIFPPGFEPDGYIPPEHTTTTSDVENCESGGGYISELEEDSTQNTDSNNYEPPGDYSSPHPEKPRHYTRKEDPKIKQSDYLKKTGTPVTQEALTSFLTSFASELQSSLLHKASANVQKHISQELNNIKHQMRSSNPPHSRLPPIEDLPPTSADNPWQSCEGTFIINEKFIVAGSSWELHKVQFWPGRKDHPNCFWRIELSAFQSKTIPSETVICGVGEAREVACKIANKAGFKMIEKWGALGSKEPLFLCEKDLTEFPFIDKIWDKCWKNFKENKAMPPQLSEFKPFAFFAPNSWKDKEHLGRIYLLFEEGKLENSVARVQLDCNHLPLIPDDLLNKEFASRKSLGRMISVFTAAQAMKLSMDQPEELLKNIKGAVNTMSKQLSPILAECFYNFFNARKSCRVAALKSCRARAEPEALISSDMLCRFLFPDEGVTKVKDNVVRDNKSIPERWRILGGQTSLNPNPRLGDRNKKRQLKFQNWGRNNRFKHYQPFRAQTANSTKQHYSQQPSYHQSSFSHHHHYNKRGRGRGRGSKQNFRGGRGSRGTARGGQTSAGTQ